MELSYGLKFKQNQIAKLGNKVEVISEMRKLINEQFDQAIERYFLEILKWIYDWRRLGLTWVKFQGSDLLWYYLRKSDIRHCKSTGTYQFTAYYVFGSAVQRKKFDLDLELMYGYITGPAFHMTELDSNSDEVMKFVNYGKYN
jgi:hypothetical protein